MKNIKLILIVAALIFINFEYVLGCVCIPTTTLQKIEQAQSIFSGRIIGRTATKLRFKVQKWWKGTPYYEIFIYADSKVITSCDVSFKNSETYLVYTFSSGSENKPETNQCTGTKELAAADEDLKILGKGKPPTRKMPRIRKRRSS